MFLAPTGELYELLKTALSQEGREEEEEGEEHKWSVFGITRNAPFQSDSAGPMWTKIGTVKQLDPGNKPLVAFLQNLQI